jgi:hypothetical protein
MSRASSVTVKTGAPHDHDPRLNSSFHSGGGYNPYMSKDRGSSKYAQHQFSDDTVDHIPARTPVFSLCDRAAWASHSMTSEVKNFVPVYHGFVRVGATIRNARVDRGAHTLTGTAAERASLMTKMKVQGRANTRLPMTDRKTASVGIDGRQSISFGGVMTVEAPVTNYETGDEIAPQPGMATYLVPPHPGKVYEYPGREGMREPVLIPADTASNRGASTALLDMHTSWLRDAADAFTRTERPAGATRHEDVIAPSVALANLLGCQSDFSVIVRGFIATFSKEGFTVNAAGKVTLRYDDRHVFETGDGAVSETVRAKCSQRMSDNPTDAERLTYVYGAIECLAAVFEANKDNVAPKSVFTGTGLAPVQRVGKRALLNELVGLLSAAQQASGALAPLYMGTIMQTFGMAAGASTIVRY